MTAGERARGEAYDRKYGSAVLHPVLNEARQRPDAYQGLDARTPPGEVLRQQAVLHDNLAHPGKTGLSGYIYGFARRVANVTGPAHMSQMFHPYQPAASVEEATKWCMTVARGLFEAQSYQVTGDMIDAVTGVYEKSTTGSFHVEEASLPSANGFLWLDKPMVVTDKWGRRVAERALTWQLTTARIMFPNRRSTDGFGRPLPEPPVEVVPAIRLSTWSYIEDDRRLLAEQQERGEIPTLAGPDGKEYAHGWDYLWEEFRELAALGDLSLSHSLTVMLGERHPWNFGKAPHPEEADGDFRPDNMLAWIYTLWMFMGTEIVTMPRPRIDRSSLRRAKGSILQNEVNVVLLRRSIIRPEATDDPEARHIDWSCRWLVSGHHRHIDGYLGDRHHAVPRAGLERSDDDHDWCAICWSRGETVRVAWVKPHLRGPEDRPLKASKQLHKLVR
jgi:hypothetical protein